MSSLRNSYGKVSGTRGIVLRSATDDGVFGGDSSANVDGSITPVKFFVQPLPNQNFELSQVSIEVSDSGNPSIEDYGSIVGPLTNGIQFFLEVDGIEVDFGLPIKSNRELINLGPLSQEINFSGSTTVSTHSFNIFEHVNTGVILRGVTDDKFGFIIRDDLSSLISHNLTVKGNFTPMIV